MKNFNKKEYFALTVTFVSYQDDVVTASPSKDEVDFASDVYGEEW